MERITKTGKLLNTISFDDIPKLINVLMDMFLIDKRPVLFYYLSLWSYIQASRHEVRPSITGWEEVNGRNIISCTKKLEYDFEYVDKF